MEIRDSFFLLFGVVFSLFMFPLYFAILLFIGLLLLIMLCLIFLVQGFESGLGGLVNLSPHAANDLSHLGNLGIRVLALHIFIDFLLVKEKG
jgi:hypothetical protein